jgi:cytochrome c oxidase subunit 2
MSNVRRFLLPGFAAAWSLLAAGASPSAAPDAARPYLVRVTGHEFNWLIRHAGRDGRLDTDDDVLERRNLRLPAESPIRIELESDDYVYSFELPHLAQKEMAVPELSFPLEFRSGPPGHFAVRGNQMCGYAHPSLMGELTIVPRADFLRWLESGGGS